MQRIKELIYEKLSNDSKFLPIVEKVFGGERLVREEGMLLYQEAELPLLGLLAEVVRRRINGTQVTFNRNFHFEPTNICMKNCAFCSYKRRFNEEGAWEEGIEELRETIKKYKDKKVTEVHITGGVHPDRGLDYYCDMVRVIKEEMPELHVKAFSAVEIEAICKISKVDFKTGLMALKEAGLGSIPGGGAEIFDEEVRKQISPDKATSEEWLDIHETAHGLGMKTNATMLYGLIEDYSHRLDHMERLRSLQDKTDGFNTFIPLKFRRYNNAFSHVEESTTTEDLRNYAISRIYVDNIPHLKAYWPMIGKEVAQLSLSYGVDDLDGTIDDSTKIYSMAGAVQNPSSTTQELVGMIHDAGKTAAERDTLYNIIERFE
ncbi:aminofutalosine synthase MqnE [Halosquirtibacter xylanolyticus]|uniref:aminofutalosine synthase MqnE n=1 Tax=Halosquirtibacter xylanolyticus TaxID=3374599 RepID=UPI00374A929B|nr:aminofutalosine synthase MqnE [Prolixibacteraceae bacterium]